MIFGSGDRFALVIRQRVHMQHERLLDLGVVEQVAVAARRDLRVIGKHDRRPEDRVVVLARQHGPGVDALALALERRHEPAVIDTDQDVNRDQ